MKKLKLPVPETKLMQRGEPAYIEYKRALDKILLQNDDIQPFVFSIYIFNRLQNI